MAFAGCFSASGLRAESAAGLAAWVAEGGAAERRLAEAGRAWSDDRACLIAWDSSLAADPRSGCVALFAGRLDNGLELRTRLGEHDDLLAHRNDAMLLLAGYQKWGSSLAERLRGDFALAVWDPRQATLLLARDPIGVSPLYYARRRGVLFFASELERLLAHPEIPDQLNDSALLTYLYALPRSTRSFYAHAQQVPAGHVLESTPTSFRSFRFWTWPERPSTRRVALAAATEEFRQLLEESLRARLAQGQVAIFLSGGLDSSGICALAGHLSRREGLERPRVYSKIYDRFASCDEREYARAVVRPHGLEHTELVADSWWTLSRFAEWLPRFTEPYFGPYDDGVRRMLAQAGADGCRVAITGHGGDDLLTGSIRYLSGWLLRGHVRGVWHELSAQSRRGNRGRVRGLAAGVVLPLAPPSVEAWLRFRRPLPLRAWMPPRLRGAVEPERRIGRYGRHASWYLLRDVLAGQSHPGFHAYLARMTSSFGLELTIPYLDARLASFVLELPPELLQREGRTKAILRDGLRDVIPASVVERTDKTTLHPLSDYGLRRQAGVLRALARDSELERRELVAAHAWQDGIERRLAGEQVPIWYSLTLELWLRHRAGRLPEELLSSA